MKHPSTTLVFSLLGTLLSPVLAGADQPEFRSFSGSKTTNLDCSVKARLFPDFNLNFLTEGFSTADGSENSIRCTGKVRDGGKGRKGVKVILEGQIVDLDTGTVIRSLPRKTRKTDKDGNLLVDFPLGDLPEHDLEINIDAIFKKRKKVDSANVECAARNRMPCQQDNETLCLLNDGRFRVDVDWRSSSSSGTGQVISSTFDSGIFYFFNPNNQDLLVQLLDACSNNDHFWVFANASTNVEFDLRVTDTETGETRLYENELGQPAPPIQDTSAFATCP